MGAGKTTFIQALCTVIGVKETMSSPTFSIVNEYAYNCEGTSKPVFHIDLYRLKDAEEAIRAGIEDVLHSEHLCFIEWPEGHRNFSGSNHSPHAKRYGDNLRNLSIENQ
jgi:tRNA threonylcarbamoyladenosine biosynthesis protein TsaE